MSEVRSTFRLQIGDAAPTFSLPDANGRMVSLTDAAGPRGLLVVFACNHCPFVVHLADALGEVARHLAAEGVHTIAINSNDAANYPQDAPSLMPAFAKKHLWDFPYLVDESQSVALAYGAACTPDFFLFDGNLKLFYTGQFDHSRPRSNQIADGADLLAAARLMLDGKPVPERPYPSSGCNIKWKAGNQPGWWNSGVSPA
jgi:peroxiredoxin